MFDALAWIAGWFGEGGGIVDFFNAAMLKAVEWYTLAKIKSLIWSVEFAWSVAKSVLQSLGAADFISGAFAALPETAANALRFFGFDQFVDAVLTASVTKYVMRLVGL